MECTPDGWVTQKQVSGLRRLTCTRRRTSPGWFDPTSTRISVGGTLQDREEGAGVEAAVTTQITSLMDDTIAAMMTTTTITTGARHVEGTRGQTPEAGVEGSLTVFITKLNNFPLSPNSRSRSRRRRRSYTRSRSRSRRSSRSRSKRSKSRQRSRKRDSRSASKAKLVTTLRDGDTKKPPPSTRRNRSRSGSGWSSDGYRKSGRSRKKKKSSWSRDNSPDKRGQTPEQPPRSAREIQLHVQKKLQEQEASKEKRFKELEGDANGDDSERSNKAAKRSASVDSSKFKSPKRAVKSATPDLAVAV